MAWGHPTRTDRTDFSRSARWLLRLFAIGLLALTSQVAHAQNALADALSQQSDFLPVREAYRLDGELQADGHLRLYWQIADGYYLYQHGFKVRVAGLDAATPLHVDFPPALEKTDEFFGEVRVYYDHADLAVTLPEPPAAMTLAITYQGCADAGLCYPPETEYLALDPMAGSVSPVEKPSKKAASAPSSTAPLSPTPAGALTLWVALGLAFLGGLILNAMPCVFPILSLKVLSFATGDPAQHRSHGLVYLAGVVTTFLLVASVLISLQNAGRWVGWGFQLQSTGFVVALAYLFTLMGLSLSGLVQFGGRWMNIGSNLATAPGLQGSFFTGVLAVVVASPCTAPFMGSALGFALTQPPASALAVFAALGVGMAFPMVALSMSDVARRWLPKPGAWMETLKQIMAFPLYLTAVWLLWVAGKQTGVDTMAAASAGLILMALGLYLLGGRGLNRAVGVVCLVAAVFLGGIRGVSDSSSKESAREGVVAWSADALAALQSDGRPVFVDVTADWCITCLANEQAVLFTDEMTAAFATAGVTYMVADWTTHDPDIGGFVREHGRNGIPLYVLYYGDQRAPLLLPQILTRGVLLDALATLTR